MKEFSFYCCPADGPSIHLEMRAFASPEAAGDFARRLLEEHASAAHVEIWADEALAGRIDRQPPAAPTDRSWLSPVLDAQSVAEPDVAIIVTTFEGEVTYWNRAAARLYGWRAEEALGRNILDLTPAAQSRSDAAAIMQSLRAGTPWQGEIVVRRRDGNPFRAFVIDLPLQASEPMIVGLSVPADARGHLDRSREVLERRVRAALAAP